jgi:hypothetical protein
LAQVEEIFNTADQVNTKVDILWVVDNSASMDAPQQKLRDGFSSFASKYLQPTWDIRVGVITTDTYLANSAYSGYRDATIAGTVGWTSPYISGRLASWVNPASNPTLVNTMTGVFTNGVKIKDQYPYWNANYALMLAGIHDGPMSALCSELHPYFYSGATDCRVRDAAGANTGVNNCITPAGAESSITQCVNTVQNDSIHSGKAIIETLPPTGTAGDAAWVNQITREFMVNASVGAAGNGSERGMASVLQLIADNESTGTAFFRRSSVRVIIFVSDEDDQTQTYPTPVPGGYTPTTGYSSVCSAKNVDGHTYTLSLCPNSANLVPVADVKSSLDTFFKNLDSSSDNANYLVASIVALTGASIQSLQAARDVYDAQVGAPATVSVDRGDRYMELGSLVGNGSLNLDIADGNYSALLDSIGVAIAKARATYPLKRAPTGQEDMIVLIIRDGGAITKLNNSQYTVSGKTLTITDVNFVLSLTAKDRIYINYQPKTVL